MPLTGGGGRAQGGRREGSGPWRPRLHWGPPDSRNHCLELQSPLQYTGVKINAPFWGRGWGCLEDPASPAWPRTPPEGKLLPLLQAWVTKRLVFVS